MIQLSIRGNAGRKTVIVSETDTVREVLERNGFPTAGVSYNLNGSFFTDARAIEKTFAEHGVRGQAFLMAVKNAENA